MAKIITENFKVETTNELFNSFKSQNDVLANTFETELTALNTATFNSALDANNIGDVKSIVEIQLETLRPEADYYIMASRSLSNVDSVPTIQNTQFDKRDFQRKVIFGNKIDNDSARYMFYENAWTPGTVYDAFDDTKDIENTNSIVSIRSSDDDYLIFKCIENNNGSPSYTSPQSVVADLSTTGYQSIETSDKYIWHYMFTVVASEAQIYKTSNSLPLPTSAGDPDVIANAKECISQIIIESTPTNHFNQFVFNNGTNSSTVSKVSQSPLDTNPKQIQVTLSVQNATVLSNAQDFYKHMYLRVAEGDNAGKLFDIVETSSRPQLSEIVVIIEFNQQSDIFTLPAELELVPKVSVSTPQVGGVRAKSYGIINRFGTLVRVAFENKGEKYKFATAKILNPQGLTDTTPTVLRVVLSPKGGHGSNPINEMAMSRLAIVTNFSGEAVTIPSSNYYTQVGLIKNPKFSKVTGSTTKIIDKSTPDSFDNRTELGVTGNQTGIAIPGYFIQQHVEISDVTDKVDGRKYVIVDTGNLSADEWTNTMGVQASDQINGEIIPGVQFTANAQAVDSSKTGKIASAVDNANLDKNIETIKGLIHESVYSSGGNATLIFTVDNTGDFQNNFLPGKVEIKATEQSQSGNTLTINSFDHISYGSYVPYSGELLHYIDFSPIERQPQTKEKIKFLFDF